VQAGLLEANPMLQMETPEAAEPKANVRPLTVAEVKTFWHSVADVLPEYCRVPYTRILKLCLLTGCRVSEAAEMDMANIVVMSARSRARGQRQGTDDGARPGQPPGYPPLAQGETSVSRFR
jgi:integrase